MILETPIPDLLIISPEVHYDSGDILVRDIILALFGGWS